MSPVCLLDLLERPPELLAMLEGPLPPPRWVITRTELQSSRQNPRADLPAPGDWFTRDTFLEPIRWHDYPSAPSLEWFLWAGHDAHGTVVGGWLELHAIRALYDDDPQLPWRRGESVYEIGGVYVHASQPRVPVLAVLPADLLGRWLEWQRSGPVARSLVVGAHISIRASD